MKIIYDLISILLPFEWLEPTFMKNAFLAVLIAAPLFGTLGSVVVSNQMAFYSDAIGHSALTGIALGVLLGVDEPIIAMILFSIIFGFAIITVKSRGKSSADSIIGVFSSTSMALGIVLLSATGTFSKYSKYLVGDILSIRSQEILMLFIAAFCLLIIWIFFYNKMLLTNLHRTFAKSRGLKVFFIEQLFAILTAVIVTISIRWTGLLVINSMLVLPAAASRMVTRSSRSYIFCSLIISLISGITGLAISWFMGAASGAVIVLVNATLFLLCLIESSVKSLILKK